MKIIDCIQQSDEWIAIRLGMVTASKFSIATAGGEGKTRNRYMKDLYIEIDEQLQTVSYRDKNMREGTEKEPFAREYYELVNDVNVQQVGFVILNDFIGGSPDGFVGDDGIIEIKCPLGVTHYDYYTGLANPYTSYKKQIQGLLWLTGRKWCDFISYRPESKNRPFYKVRLNRDEKYIKELAIQVTMFVNELKNLVKQLTQETNF